MYLLLISSNNARKIYNFYLAHQIQQLISKLRILNVHEFLNQSFFFDHIKPSEENNDSSFWHWLLNPVSKIWILLQEKSRIFLNNCVNVNIRLHSNLHFPIKRMKNIKQLVQSNKLDMKALWFIIYSTEYNAMQQRKNHIQFGINVPVASKGNEWRSMTFGRPDNLLCN